MYGITHFKKQLFKRITILYMALCILYFNLQETNVPVRIRKKMKIKETNKDISNFLALLSSETRWINNFKWNIPQRISLSGVKKTAFKNIKTKCFISISNYY